MDHIINHAAEQLTPREFFTDPTNLAAVPSAIRPAIAACQRYEAYALPDSHSRASVLEALVSYLASLGFSLDAVQRYLECPISAALRPGEDEYDESEAFQCGAFAVERLFYKARPTVYGSTTDMFRAADDENTPQCQRERLCGLIAPLLVLKDPANPGIRYVMSEGGTYAEYPIATVATSCKELLNHDPFENRRFCFGSASPCGVRPARKATSLASRAVLAWLASPRRICGFQTGRGLAWAHTASLDGTLRVEKQRDWPTVQAENSRLAKHVQPSIAAPATYYDPSTSTLHVAFYATRPDAREEFHPGIDAFVRQFAAAKADKLLDYFATYRDLSRPTAALCFTGATRTGKGAMAALLASALPSNGAPTPVPVRQFLADKNDDVKRSPLVAIDENIPVTWSDGFDAVDGFKRDVQATEIQLRGMYKATVTVPGALRFVFMVNGYKSLARFVSCAAPEDSEALALRLIDIRPPASSRVYLERIGGWDTISGWIRTGAFARYVAWLEQTRTVARSTDFLCMGDGAQLLRDVAAHSGPNAAVLNALARCLSEPGIIAKSERGSIIVKDGAAWVNAALLAGRTWSAIESTEPAPTARRAGMAIASVGTETRSMGATRAKYSRLDLAALASATDADVETLRRGVAALGAPVPEPAPSAVAN